MGYQFISINTYSRQASRTGKKQSADGMIAEIERQPDACPHIIEPSPPKHMYGLKPFEALALAKENAGKATDSIGRKLRKDAQIIASAIVSFPKPMSELTPHDPELKLWLEKNHQFFLKKYGDQYVSATAHLDERFFHLHVLLIPKVNGQGVLNIGSIHQGIKARDELKTKKIKLKNRAYKKAMRAYQEEYYENVGLPCGLTKDGPRRRRLSRKEWIQEQAHAERLADAIEQIKYANEKMQQANDKYHKAQKHTDKAHERALEASKLIRLVREKRKELIELKSKKNEVVRYLKNKLAAVNEELIPLKCKLEQLESQHAHLKSNKQKLEVENRSLLKQKEQLTYQNNIRVKGLTQRNFELKIIKSLIDSGRFDELKKFQFTKDKAPIEIDNSF